MQRKTLLLVLLGPLAQDFQDFPDSADVFHGWYFDTQFCKKRRVGDWRGTSSTKLDPPAQQAGPAGT